MKQGWSWTGFFFDIIWALVKKMWALSIGLIVFFVVLGVIEVALGMGEFSSIIIFIIKIILGVKGNKWRENRLISRGYEYKDTIMAENPEAAIAW